MIEMNLSMSEDISVMVEGLRTCGGQGRWGGRQAACAAATKKGVLQSKKYILLLSMEKPIVQCDVGKGTWRQPQCAIEDPQNGSSDALCAPAISCQATVGVPKREYRLPTLRHEK